MLSANPTGSSQLSTAQIRELFKLLKLPPERASEGTPIYIACPFEKLHTKPTRPRDCRLHFDVFPHIWCFHESCAEERRGLNDYLRLVITGTSAFPREEDGAEPPDYAYANEVRERLSEFLRKFRGRRRKQQRIEIRPANFLARAFAHVPGKFIWTGALTSTGSFVHRANFRTVDQWLQTPPSAGWLFTCPSTFVEGSFNRNDAHVDSLEYLVLESDDHSPEDTAALFEWFEATFETPLWAIVHSGRRGPHGWFFPHPGGREWLRLYKPALVAAGFCGGTLTPSQPVRLAGQIRPDTGKEQLLLFIAPKNS